MAKQRPIYTKTALKALITTYLANAKKAGEFAGPGNHHKRLVDPIMRELEEEEIELRNTVEQQMVDQRSKGGLQGVSPSPSGPSASYPLASRATNHIDNSSWSTRVSRDDCRQSQHQRVCGRRTRRRTTKVLSNSKHNQGPSFIGSL